MTVRKLSDAYMRGAADALVIRNHDFHYSRADFERYQSGIHTMTWNDAFAQWLSKNRPELLKLEDKHD